MIPYGLNRRLRCGIRLSLTLSFKCNYTCSYCALNIPSETAPKAEVQDMKFWENYIETFPIRVREIFITGGEPSLLPYFSEFVNWALNKGLFVAIYSNISRPSIYKDVIKSNRLRIKTTYHNERKLTEFQKNYKIVKSIGHRIDVDEIGNEKYIDNSKLKPELTKQNIIDYYEPKCLYVDPIGTIYRNCYDMFRSCS